MGNPEGGSHVEAMMNRIARLTAVALVAVALLGSCRDRGSFGGGGAPDSPVTSSPPSSPIVEEPTPTIVEPRGGLVDPHPVDWFALKVLDERTLMVQFYGGVEACYGLARVDVAYRDAVTVTLYEGREPTAEVCIELAMLKATRIHLEEPLAGRPVLDGAETK